MTIGDVKELFDRVGRIIGRIRDKAGQGAEWKVESPDYGTQTYKITGVKSYQELEDDFANLSVWVWSIKDYLKKLASSLGKDPNDVERFVDADMDLKICSDPANTAKHAKLNRKSRTGQYLRMGRLRYTVPLKATSGLTFSGNENNQIIDVSQPDAVEIIVPVLDQSGNEVGEAFTTFRNGVRAWERLLNTFTT